MKTWKRMDLYGGYFCTDIDRVVAARVTPCASGSSIRITGHMSGAEVTIKADLKGGGPHKGKLEDRRLMAKIEWDKR